MADKTPPPLLALLCGGVGGENESSTEEENTFVNISAGLVSLLISSLITDLRGAAVFWGESCFDISPKTTGFATFSRVFSSGAGGGTGCGINAISAAGTCKSRLIFLLAKSAGVCGAVVSPTTGEEDSVVFFFSSDLTRLLLRDFFLRLLDELFSGLSETEAAAVFVSGGTCGAFMSSVSIWSLAVMQPMGVASLFVDLDDFFEDFFDLSDFFFDDEEDDEALVFVSVVVVDAGDLERDFDRDVLRVFSERLRLEPLLDDFRCFFLDMVCFFPEFFSLANKARN